MIKKLSYSGKEITLKSYNTKQERDLLIFSGTPKELGELLNDNIITDASFTEEEFIAILYILRSISIGESFDIKIKCSNCKKVFDVSLNVSEMITNSTLSDEYNDVISDDLKDFVNFDVDELDVNEYDKLQDYIDNNKTKFNFIHERTCPYCQLKNKIDLNDFKTCVSSLSEDDISTFYETINKLIFYGHYDMQGIFEMFPYERIIYIGLLTKEMEKVSKANNQKK